MILWSWYGSSQNKHYNKKHLIIFSWNNLCRNRNSFNYHCPKDYSTTRQWSVKGREREHLSLVWKCWTCWLTCWCIIISFVQQVLIQTTWSQWLWCLRGHAYLTSPLSPLAEASTERSFCCSLSYDQKSISLLWDLSGVPKEISCPAV